MGFFRDVFMKSTPGASDPRNTGQSFKVRWAQAPKRHSRDYADLFHTSPAFDSLDLIAQDIANTGFLVYDKKAYKTDPEGAKAFKDHAFYDLIDNPMPDHQELDGYALLHMTAVYMDVAGEFFWVKERDNRGNVKGLYPVPPNWMITTPSETIPFFKILPQGNTSYNMLNASPEDVVWFKAPDMLMPYGRGRGGVERAGQEIQSDELASKYQTNLLFNDGQPPMIVTLPDAGADTVEQLKESWMQKVGGWINARKPFFTNTKVDVQKLTDSPREMDMVESRLALRDFFNQHYSIPPEMRGIVENSNRATIQSADYLYKSNVLGRRAKRIAQILTRQLMPDFGVGLICIADVKIPADETAQFIQAIEAFKAGAITENEFRAKTGHKAAPDGDVRLRAISLQVVPAGKGKEVSARQQELPFEAPPIKSITISKALDMMKSKFTPNAKAAHWELFDKIARSGENTIRAAAEKEFRRQEKETRAIFDAAIKAGMKPDAAMDEVAKQVYNKTADEMFRDGLAPGWMQSMTQGYKIASNLLGGGISFDLYNAKFMDWIKTEGMDHVVGINESTVKMLREAIQPGIEAGESMDKIADRLYGKYEEFYTGRSMNIARTETMGAVNYGQLETYAGEGIEEKEWLSTIDGDSRDGKDGTPNHVSANGQKRKVLEPFDVWGEKLMFPGDQANGTPANICRCRCTILPIMEYKE